MMKRIFSLVLLCCIPLIGMAQKAPKWLEKQRKAVLKVTLYDQNDKIIGQGNAFFISGAGDALSGYSLFKGAERATVTDIDGKIYPVESIIGADEMYDIIKFKVTVPKKITFFSLAVEPLNEGAKVYMLPYSTEKKANFKEGTISEVNMLKEPFGYYKTTLPMLSEDLLNTPVLTENGQLIGMMQDDAAGNKEISYLLSAGYGNNLSSTSTDLLGVTYKSIGIRKAWPVDIEEAQIALTILASTQKPEEYVETLNDFIKEFSEHSEGYLSRASHYVYHRADLAGDSSEEKKYLDLSLVDFEKALQNSQDKGAVLYDKAKTIYNVVTHDTTVVDNIWSFDSAMSILQEAIKYNDLSLYRQLEGDIFFAQEDYEQAYNSYMLVNEGEAPTASAYYWAAKAKEQIPGTNIYDLISLMDRAIELTTEVQLIEKLNFLLTRVDYKMQLMLFDEAITDYNLYYDLVKGGVNDNFFFLREKAKFRAEDYKGALDDIDEAILLAPENPDYLAEKASIYMRMQNYEEALKVIDKALVLAPDFASCYRLKGICYVRMGDKEKACEAFHKAKELGDTFVQRLITEHCS